MPVDTHLQWAEMRDFTGGVWDVSDLVMPPNAAAQMIDCLPGPSGGLRAFTKRTSFTTAGMSNPSTEAVRGLWVNENLVKRSGGGLANDYWMLAYKSSDTICRLYRLDKTVERSGTDGATNSNTNFTSASANFTQADKGNTITGTNIPASTTIASVTNSTTIVLSQNATGTGTGGTWSIVADHWVNKKSFSAGLDPGPVRFTNYFDSTGTNLYIAFSLQSGGGADAGVWYVDYATGSPTRLTATTGMVWNYQSRLIVTKGATIWFTDPGLFTNIDVNKALIDPNEGNNSGIIATATFSPGDLLVFKGGAPIYLVEGDLTNFQVRQMNGAKIVANGGVAAVCKGPMGVIFRCAYDGVYETPDGNQVNPLSKGLSASHFDDTPIQTYFTWSGKYLLDHGTGFVLDYSSKAWFTTSMQGGGVGCTMARTNQWFLADNSTGTVTLWTLPANADESTGRAESYTWKSAPIRDQTGRQIRIRAVEVYARSFNNATSSITVTIGSGAPVTLSCDASGIGGITFYSLSTSEEQQVTVTAASNQAGVQAPVVEVIRLGTQQGHFLKHGAD